MTTAFGALALLLTLIAFWSDLIDQDPNEAHRTTLESWRAMSIGRKCELASMMCIGIALILEGR